MSSPRQGPHNLTDSRQAAPARAHRNAIVLLAFCALCWSTAGVFTRHLQQAESFEVTFWRSFFCMVGVTLALAWQQRGNPLEPVIRIDRKSVV